MEKPCFGILHLFVEQFQMGASRPVTGASNRGCCFSFSTRSLFSALALNGFIFGGLRFLLFLHMLGDDHLACFHRLFPLALVSKRVDGFEQPVATSGETWQYSTPRTLSIRLSQLRSVKMVMPNRNTASRISRLPTALNARVKASANCLPQDTAGALGQARASGIVHRGQRGPCDHHQHQAQGPDAEG